MKEEYQSDAIPHMVAHGKFVIQYPNNKIDKLDFLVMNRYYFTLEEYVKTQDKIDYKKIFEMMI